MSPSPHSAGAQIIADGSTVSVHVPLTVMLTDDEKRPCRVMRHQLQHVRNPLGRTDARIHKVASYRLHQHVIDVNAPPT